MLLPACVEQEFHVLRIKLSHEAMQIAILTQINLRLNSAAMSVVVLPAAVNCHTHKLLKYVIWLPVRRLTFIINTTSSACSRSVLGVFTSESTVTIHHSDLHIGYSH